ncbi:MAG: VOC family protein [Rickettsiales bacterium]|nr:VOC family protein [Rickettsiales bacterium]
MYPFHLSIPVSDLDIAKDFYSSVFDCKIGRTGVRWADFDFFGHQLTIHLAELPQDDFRSNNVDGHNIPVRHFGLVLDWDIWHEIKDRLLLRDVTFVVKPHIRFKDKPGEQASMFFLDPSNNVLELKAFKDSANLFVKNEKGQASEAS